MTLNEYLQEFAIRTQAFAVSSRNEVSSIAASLPSAVSSEVTFFLSNASEIYGFYLWETASDLAALDRYLVKNYVRRSLSTFDWYLDNAEIIVDTWVNTCQDVLAVGNAVRTGLSGLAADLSSLAESVVPDLDFEKWALFVPATGEPYILGRGGEGGGAGASGEWFDEENFYYPRIPVKVPPFPALRLPPSKKRFPVAKSRGGCVNKRFPKLGEIFYIDPFVSYPCCRVFYFSNFREIVIRTRGKIWINSPPFANGTPGFAPAVSDRMRSESFPVSCIAENLSMLAGGCWGVYRPPTDEQEFLDYTGLYPPISAALTPYYQRFVGGVWLCKEFTVENGKIEHEISSDFRQSDFLPDECSDFEALWFSSGDCRWYGTYFWNNDLPGLRGRVGLADGKTKTFHVVFSSATLYDYASGVSIFPEKVGFSSAFLHESPTVGVKNYG